MKTRYLDLICVAVLGVILTLGLWPFHAPQNGVNWLGYCNGLRFGRPGTAIASRPFSSSPPEADATCSIEIWLQPERVWDSATVLAFYTPGGLHQFALRQSLADLEVQAGDEHFYVPNTFRKPRPVFLTITAGTSGTAVYVNGALAKATSQFRISAQDFTGRLILADSPAQPDNWSGMVLGLAIYRRELAPPQVRRHYQTWTRTSLPEISTDDRNIALYLFDERVGKVVHDRTGTAADLDIPERYYVLDKVFLEPFWKEFSFSRSFWDSVVKNIIGFLPFGFFFYPCLTLHRLRRPALLTVIMGAMVSVTIEVLQAYLPTRDSGTTDIFTNTLGTWAGVIAFRCAGVLMRKYQTNRSLGTDTVDC